MYGAVYFNFEQFRRGLSGGEIRPVALRREATPERLRDTWTSSTERCAVRNKIYSSCMLENIYFGRRGFIKYYILGILSEKRLTKNKSADGSVFYSYVIRKG